VLRVESTVDVRRSVDQVFGYLSDPGNWTQWLEGIVESSLEEGQTLRQGARVRQVIKFLGRRFDVTAEVIEYQAGDRIGMRVLSGPFPMAWTHVLQQAGEGTRLTTSLEVDPGTYFRLAGPLLKPVLQRHFDADHAGLKALLEAPVPA
jgi:carbon monoxide dehydrogenase subunit G